MKLLLEEGYKVRGTVRSLANEKKVQPLRELCPQAAKNLELVEADLTSLKGWKEAVTGCPFVMHMASPFPASEPQDAEKELFQPAIEGTKLVLKICAEVGGVKRVILTSSCVAIMCKNYSF